MSWAQIPDFYDSLRIVYEERVPVRIRAPDKTERVEDVNVRMSLGRSKEGRGVQVLVIQVSSDGDLYFLHTLEVNEDDFQHLKVDQGILVDFHAFPEKLSELLQLCIDARGEDPAKFIAELAVRGSESRLSVIETNLFKQITHISLGFRPGSDAAVKQYLATRLTESRTQATSLRESLEEAQRHLERTQQAAAASSSELREERDSYGKERVRWQADLAARLAEAKEAHLRELEEVRQGADRDKAELEGRLRAQVAELERKGSELDRQRRELQDQKYALDARVSELSARLGASDGELRALRDEADRMQRAGVEAAGVRVELEKALNERRVEVAALQQQAKAQEEMVGTLRRQLADAEGARASLSETLAEVRSANRSLEARLGAAAAEVDKGNQIIDRLQADLKAARAKMKLKAAVIAQQESLLNERQGQLEKVTRESLHLQQALDREEHARRVLEARAADQQKKLDESQALLESNQQMIQWLNAQVTEAQLGRYSVGSTRYSFRSTVQLPGQGGSGGRDGRTGSPSDTMGAAAGAGSLALKYAQAAAMPRSMAMPGAEGDEGAGGASPPAPPRVALGSASLETSQPAVRA